MRHPRFDLVLSVVVLIVSAACDNTSGPKTGSLIVNVSAPAGISGAVTVTGPGSYSKTVTTTDTLRGLSAGRYTIAAGNSSSSDTIVSVLYTGAVTGSPATVTDGGTATASATYTMRTGSGALWVGAWHGPSIVASYASASLAGSGTPTPTDTIGDAGSPTHEPLGVAFDASGNLWVADYQDDTIREFTVAQLTNGASTPTTELAFPLEAPCGIAFDSTGNLWIAFYASDSVGELSAATLATVSGTVAAPALTTELSVPNGAVGVAFDAAHDLWVGAFDGETVYEFPPSQQMAGGIASDSLQSTALHEVSGLAFDSSGNLWAATESGVIAQYTPSQLTSATPPSAPNNTLIVSSARLDGVVFDNSGNLWVTEEVGSPSSVVEFSPAQLTAGGTQSPSKTVGGNGGDLFALAFDPHASGLPIAGLHAPRAARSMTHITGHASGTPTLIGHAQSLGGIATHRRAKRWQ
jgi:sugar lactone lactonase YvrE